MRRSTCDGTPPTHPTTGSRPTSAPRSIRSASGPSDGSSPSVRSIASIIPIPHPSISRYRRTRVSIMTAQVTPMRDRKGRAYTPAVGPRLRPLLWIILISFAVLGANGFYLASVTALTWYLGTTQQTFFYMLMVLLHLMLGFLLIVPFLT